MTDSVAIDERVLATTEIAGAIVQDVGGFEVQHDSLVLINDGVPTQVANPKRASWRTIVQSLVGILVVLAPLLNIVTAQVVDYLQSQTALEVSPWVFVVLNGVLAVTAFVIGLVSRVMNTPGVNEWIKAHLPWLAPIPLHRIETPPAPDSQPLDR